MSITTDSNIFTIHDGVTLLAMPVGTVVAELDVPEGDKLWHAEVVSDSKIRQVNTDPKRIESEGHYGPDQGPNVLYFPVRVVNPELLGISEGEIVPFKVGQRVRVIDSIYSSNELQAGVTATVVQPSLVGWDYTVRVDSEIPFYGDQNWGFDAHHLASLVEPVVVDEEEPLTEWERELLEGPTEEPTFEEGERVEVFGWPGEVWNGFAEVVSVFGSSVSVKPEEGPYAGVTGNFDKEYVRKVEKPSTELVVPPMGRCCGKYEACPMAEPLGVTVTVFQFEFAPVGN
jgi:hypothetical protein